MTLSQKIKRNPYLKPYNCSDLADYDVAIIELEKLDAEYGANNKTLLKLWAKFFDRKKKIEG